MTNKIRVAVIAPGLGHVSRGVETWFNAYLQEFVKKDNLELIVFGGGKNFNIAGVTYVHVPCIKRQWFTKFPSIGRLHLKHSHSYESLTFALMLGPLMLWHSIDIAFFSDFPFTLVPLKLYRALRNKNLKTVFTPGGGIGFFYSRFFTADVVTAIEPTTHKLFSKKFNSVLIPPGVDHSAFKPQPEARTQLGLPTNQLIIFSSSAFDPIKRIDFLITAVSKMPNTLLLLASTGPQRAYLEKLGKELLGERVRFLGVLDKPTLAKYYAASDVFCLPSKAEPFGLVSVEAMASGTPVVTSNTDVQRWIVAEGGACIDIENESSLINALEQYRNPLYRQHASELAQKNAERFSWTKAGEEYCQLFHKLVH